MGLDYGGVEAAMRLLRWPVESQADDFGKLQVMESAFIAAAGEKHERSRKD